MDIDSLLATARDTLHVRSVFGEPITQDGLTIIPVARLGGGGGGGSGVGKQGPESRGASAGLGLSCQPAGVYVIKDGKVAWRPAVDMNRVILGGQIVAAVALISLGKLARTAAWRQRRRVMPPPRPRFRRR